MTMHQDIRIPAGEAPVASPIVQFWNDTLAPKFIRYRHILMGGLSRHSDAVFPHLDIRPGQSVADVGCGFGDTAIALARLVGEKGRVTGFDCCEAFLDFARDDRDAAGLAHLDFLVADAEVALPRAAYDAVFARFGTMFFVNPVAGLRNMRRALKPGGRMTHVVWGRREDNPWLTLARNVLLDHLPQPDAGAPGCGPGPFSLSDPEHVRRLMEAAGYEGISFRRVEAKVMVGRTVEEAIAFQLAIGPAGEVFRTAGDEAIAKQAHIEADLRRLFEEQATDADGIWMDSSSWIVEGLAPR